MKWFDGGISEAVKHSQEKKALFCVVILGTDDEPSTEFLKILESSVTRSKNPDDIIWIRIDANSEQHNQFSQIYTNTTFPSIYCITTGGSSAVITNPITLTELEERLSAALVLHKQKLGLINVPAPPQTNAGSSSQGASAQPHQSSNISGQGESPSGNLSIDEKIERAKKLAAAKQQEKLREEEDDRRRREMERREAGKGATELKRWQQEQEQKKIIEERKKDKLEEQRVRQRVLEQIAADRAARNARTNVEFLESGPIKPGETPSTSLASLTSSINNESNSPTSIYSGTGKARLQFRLPDGGSHNHAFEPETTLGQVRQYISENVNLSFRDFSLWITFPRKEFTPDQYGSSLRELQLFPSSALLILPAGGNGGAQSSGWWATLCFLTTSLMGIVLYPISFLTSFFTGGAQPPPQIQRRTEGQGRPRRDGIPLGGGSGNSSVRKRKQIDSKNEGEGSSSGNKDKRGKDGNVHRLRNTEKDSDDEKTTYNGNSTTQL